MFLVIGYWKDKHHNHTQHKITQHDDTNHVKNYEKTKKQISNNLINIYLVCQSKSLIIN